MATINLDQLRSKYRAQILSVANKYHADNIRIFGSVARGETSAKSDIDILVHFKPNASLLDEAGLDRELKALLGQSVDVIGDDSLRKEFKKSILNEAVPL